MPAQEDSEYVNRRKRIDPRLKAAGWQIVGFDPASDLADCTAHAVTEFPTANGPADYALFVAGRPLGILEAKKLSLGPQNVLTQAERYSRGLIDSPFDFRGYHAPFLFSTNGEVLWFHDIRPVNLKRLINLIDETEWTTLGVDAEAAAYERLLEKAASEGKKGADQYFTPRVLIQAIVRCMKPDPRAHADFTICDPACGTGGFLVAAYECLITPSVQGGAGAAAMDRDVAKRVRRATYFGQDLVARPRRLALMNLFLHGIEPHIALGDTIYEVPGAQRFDVVLTNPPFGTKGANQTPDRDDFTIATSNKQLNLLQLALPPLGNGVQK
jgi:type I restriction-modification system DNA methylase subunit